METIFTGDVSSVPDHCCLYKITFRTNKALWVVHRRYSRFKYLHDIIQATSDVPIASPFPRSLCWEYRRDYDANARSFVSTLNYFLNEVLQKYSLLTNQDDLLKLFLERFIDCPHEVATRPKSEKFENALVKLVLKIEDALVKALVLNSGNAGERITSGLEVLRRKLEILLETGLQTIPTHRVICLSQQLNIMNPYGNFDELVDFLVLLILIGVVLMIADCAARRLLPALPLTLRRAFCCILTLAALHIIQRAKKLRTKLQHEPSYIRSQRSTQKLLGKQFTFIYDEHCMFSLDTSTYIDISTQKAVFCHEDERLLIDGKGNTISSKMEDQKSAVTSNVKKDIAFSRKVKASIPPEWLIDNFEFSDVPAEANALFRDARLDHPFKVRGPNYLLDKKKIEAGPAMGRLVLMEFFEVDKAKFGDRHDHIASMGLAKRRVEILRSLPEKPFVFVVNFQIPGDPPVSMTTYFVIPNDLRERYAGDATDKFVDLFERFADIPNSEAGRLAAWGIVDDGHGNMKGPDKHNSHSWLKVPSDITWPDPHEPGALPSSDLRNRIFKLIPTVSEGPWAVKAAVRPQPALLGQKVVQRYFKGEGYMEVDVHVGSSSIATNIVGVCRGYGKHFVADVGIVLQGETEEELPERLLACASLVYPNPDVRRSLFDFKEDDLMKPPTFDVPNGKGCKSRGSSSEVGADVLQPAKKINSNLMEAFEAFEFADISPSTRMHFEDLRGEHSFKLRGPTFHQDKKKVVPGPAMCRVMLVEIYEVERRHGDRHDHILSRGLAKKRLDTILALPGKPFVLAVNFQVPGDPPLSIVTYLALPPDLPDRHPGEETDRFLGLFNQFTDVPFDDEERLARWDLSAEDGADVPVYAHLEPSLHLASLSGDNYAFSDCEGDSDPYSDTGTSDSEKDHNPMGGHYTNRRHLSSGYSSGGSHAATPTAVRGGGNSRSSTPSRPHMRKEKEKEKEKLQRLQGQTPTRRGERSATTSSEAVRKKEGDSPGSERNPSSESQGDGSMSIRHQEALTHLSTAFESPRQDAHDPKKRGSITATLKSWIRGSKHPSDKSLDRKRSKEENRSQRRNSRRSWLKLPKDVSWASPFEPGVLPHNDMRNTRFKIIPSVVEGPFLIRHTVGTKPTILGRKLVQRYFRGSGYMEIDCDIASSVFASQIITVCKTYSKKFSTEIGIVLQADSQEELPERLLGCYKLKNVDLRVREKLGDEHDHDTEDVYHMPKDNTHKKRNGHSNSDELTNEKGDGHASEYETKSELVGKISPDLKKESVAALMDMESFEFEDISIAARELFRDAGKDHIFKVRGPDYLIDRKKVDPGPAFAKLMLLEMYEVDAADGDRHDHIASRGKAKERVAAIRGLPEKPFVFVVNFQVPGDPPISMTTYFALPLDSIEADFPGESTKRFLSLFRRFASIPDTETERLAAWGIHRKQPHPHAAAQEANSADSAYVKDEADNDSLKYDSAEESPMKAAASKRGSTSWIRMPSDITWPDPHEPGALPADDLRNKIFKLIPMIREGPWAVKAAVRPQPALLGQKVVQRYFKGEGYMEVDVHVGSSIIASQIVGVCRGYGKHFVADVGIVLQGETEEELPERLLACATLVRPDVEVRRKLDLEVRG